MRQADVHSAVQLALARGSCSWGMLVVKFLSITIGTSTSAYVPMIDVMLQVTRAYSVSPD